MTDVEGHYPCMYDFPVPSIFPDILVAGGTTRLYTSVTSLGVSTIYLLDSQQVKRDTEFPIEKRIPFVLLSRIGLETNTYPMVHKI